MAFSKGKDSVSLKEILDRVTEADILLFGCYRSTHYYKFPIKKG